MPKKKGDSKPSPEVVSLEKARKKRELDGLVEELDGLMGQQTDAVGQMIDLYHRWEEAHPDDAVTPLDKLEMVTFGFVGPVGYRKCHEAHRLPQAAFFPGPDSFAFPSDEELSEDIMCPALESGACRKVSEAMRSPPCILLGGELQRAIAPKSLNSLVEAIFDPDYRDDPEEEEERFAAAEKLVRRYDKREEAAESKPTKPRKK